MCLFWFVSPSVVSTITRKAVDEFFKETSGRGDFGTKTINWILGVV